MQKQDTILGDGQAGHVDGLGGGSQTAASLPVTEGQERTKGILGWRWLPKPQIDLEGFDAPNFAQVYLSDDLNVRVSAIPSMAHTRTWRSES